MILVDFVAKSGESLSGLIDYQRREKDGGRGTDDAGHQFSILLASHWEKLLLGAIVEQSKSHLFCGQRRRRRFAKRIFFSRRDPIVTANFTASGVGLKNLRLCMRKRPLIKTEDCAFSLLSLLHFKPTTDSNTHSWFQTWGYTRHEKRGRKTHNFRRILGRPQLLSHVSSSPLFGALLERNVLLRFSSASFSFAHRLPPLSTCLHFLVISTKPGRRMRNKRKFLKQHSAPSQIGLPTFSPTSATTFHKLHRRLFPGKSNIFLLFDKKISPS